MISSNIDRSVFGEGRVWLSLRGPKTILLSILIASLGKLGPGWAEDSEIGEGQLGWAEAKGAKYNIAIDIDSEIGEGRAGLGLAESEGAKYDVTINIDSEVGEGQLGWTEAKGAEINLAININIDSEIREGRA
ncbi:hypothetical protein BY996DRAFT_6416571 [Phakopsora pachyrhizi]|nr:hypothetical protein BY996DRAFT_6416571 [Phakopsora pachyrhizi]